MVGTPEEIGRQTQRILEAAQEAADEITDAARAQAERELAEAREQAARLLAEAEERHQATEAAAAELERARGRLARELTAAGESIASLVAALAPNRDDDLLAGVGHALEDVAGDHGDGRTQGGSAVTAADAAEEDPEPPAHDGDPTGRAGVVEAGDGADGGVDAGGSVDAEVGEGATAGVHAAAADGGAPGDTDADRLRALRDATLEPLHGQMVRRLKRGLSDVQNIVLDRLRREGVDGGVERLLPGEEDATGLGATAAPFLDQAYRAGADGAAVLAGRDLAGTDGPGTNTDGAGSDGAGTHGGGEGAGRTLADDFVAAAAARVTEPLGSTLRIAVRAEEPVGALNERIGSVFSELRGAAADELTAVHLTRAYELGQLDAWAAGGVRRRTWVLGREPRCPEGRCRHNDQAGPVEVSEPFPSGDVVPPVHPGCSCTTIPDVDGGD